MTNIRTDSRPDWARDAVFYQVFPDRFANGDRRLDPPGVQEWGGTPNRQDHQGGDLVGLLHRLEHLERLGITGLWLNPIFRASTSHRYDTHDYLQVDPRLGDEALLKDVVQEAHGRGIRVLLDGVFNHCGDGFGPFVDLIANGPDSRYADWFDVRTWPINDSPPSYQTCGGAPYLPKLNTGNREVRDHLLEVAAYWIDAVDIDGWRLDVPWKVPHDFWVEFREEVRQVKPDAYLVGEVWRDATPWLDVFDGVMNYRLRDVLLDYCLRDHMDAEDAGLELDWLTAGHGEAAPWMLNLLGCHDTPRVRTVADGDVTRTRLAQTALFTLPGIPLVYYGDELGMLGGNDPGCRAAMPADPARWWNDEADHVQRLARLRHDVEPLRRGDFAPVLMFNGLLAYRRRTADSQAIVVLNARNDEHDVEVPVDGPADWWVDLLDDSTIERRDGRLRLGTLRAGSARILVPVDDGDGVQS